MHRCIAAAALLTSFGPTVTRTMHGGCAARAEDTDPTAPGSADAEREGARRQWACVPTAVPKIVERLPGTARFADGRLTFDCSPAPHVLEARQIRAIELARPGGAADAVHVEPRPEPTADGWWCLGFADDRLRVRDVSLHGDRLECSLDTRAHEAGGRRALPPTAWQGLVRASSETGLPRLPPTRELDLDLLALPGGEEVYGQLVSISAEGLRLGGVFGMRQWPLEQVQAMRLRRRPRSPQVSAGCHVRLFWGAGDEPEEAGLQSLAGVLTGIDEEAWRIVPSEWGELAVCVAQLRRAEVEWVGVRWLLDPYVHHLGNEAEASFDVYAPEGTHWEQRFVLDEMPAAPCRLTLTVGDLEPIDSLRVIRPTPEGHLLTHVELNGHALDALNRHVREDTAPRHQVHLPVPAEWLRTGENRLVVRQTHARDDASEFDDCQLGPIWLEAETGP